LKISDNKIKIFQQIYFEKFGELIGEDQALEKAIKLVSLVNTIRKIRNNNSSCCNINLKEIKNGYN